MDGRFHRISQGQAVDRERVHGARLVPNNETDWIVIRDAHPSLVSHRLFEQVKNRRGHKVSSIEQQGKDPRLKTHGKTWQGQRSRFILSGLLTCSLCGNRYQGVTRNKGKKRNDGTRVKTYSYGCGGYITKGTAICQMNLIPKDTLESVVINAVLNFYRPYRGEGNYKRLAEIVRTQIGTEGQEFTNARQRAEEENIRITQIINNLLDNITSTNREYVDQRLVDLTQQRKQLESRLEELDHLVVSQTEINGIITDAKQFLSKLEFTLQQGLPQEKLALLRQCVERITIDKPAGKITMSIRTIPTANCSQNQQIQIPLDENNA